MRLVLWLTLAGALALSGDHALAAVVMMLLVGCATDRARRRADRLDRPVDVH